MTAVVWSYLSALFLAFIGTVVVKDCLLPPRTVIKDLSRAHAMILSEQDRERLEETGATRIILKLLLKFESIFDLEQLILKDMRNMNRLMGYKKSPEHELASYIVHGLAGGAPILFVPFLTGFSEYIFIYPIAVLAIILQKYRGYTYTYFNGQADISYVFHDPGVVAVIKVKIRRIFSGRIQEYNIYSAAEARRLSGE